MLCILECKVFTVYIGIFGFHKGFVSNYLIVNRIENIREIGLNWDQRN